MDNPFLTRLAARNKGHNGRVAEKDFSKRLSGRLRPGSGAVEGAKGDVVVAGAKVTLLVENKATQTGTMSLKRDWFYKIHQEALGMNQTPALAFQFTNEAGKSEKRERWVAVSEEFFQELMEAYNGSTP